MGRFWQFVSGVRRARDRDDRVRRRSRDLLYVGGHVPRPHTVTTRLGAVAAFARTRSVRSSGTQDGSTAAPRGAAAPAASAGAGCFRPDSYWHPDVDDLAVHPREVRAVARAHVARRDCTPTSGRRTATRRPCGIPVTVVGEDHPRVPVRFLLQAGRATGWAIHSATTPGSRAARAHGGDRHALLVDRDACRLYETFATRRTDGRWHAGSGAVWSLDGQRPATPRLDVGRRGRAADPGRPAAAARGAQRAGATRDPVHHRRHQPLPHVAGAARRGSTRRPDFPPMGARFRLDADFDPDRVRRATPAG